jgi:hypothetical protein
MIIMGLQAAACLEDEVGAFVLGEEPVDALGAGGQPVVGGALEPGAVGVHADHPAGLDDARAQQLVHEVGPDVPGTNDRGSRLSHDVIPVLYPSQLCGAGRAQFSQLTCAGK